MRAFQKVDEVITPPILLLIQYLPDVCVVSIDFLMQLQFI